MGCLATRVFRRKGGWQQVPWGPRGVLNKARGHRLLRVILSSDPSPNSSLRVTFLGDYSHESILGVLG